MNLQMIVIHHVDSGILTWVLGKRTQWSYVVIHLSSPMNQFLRHTIYTEVDITKRLYSSAWGCFIFILRWSFIVQAGSELARPKLTSHTFRHVYTFICIHTCTNTHEHIFTYVHTLKMIQKIKYSKAWSWGILQSKRHHPKWKWKSLVL